MSTPVGPAPRDANDPDLWDEWFEAGDDERARSRFGWPVRVLAIAIAVALVLLLVFAG
jgi:hypothetical protein